MLLLTSAGECCLLLFYKTEYIFQAKKKSKSHKRKPGHGYERETLREKQFLLIAVQNNAIRTNYVKVKIYNTQQNSVCRLYADKDKTIDKRM